MLLRPSSSKGIPNTFLRKKRKWPHSPYKTKWHHVFDQQQAMQNLKKLASFPYPPLSQIQPESQNPHKTPYLLSCLINSFKTYNCDPTPTAYHFVIKTLILKSQFSELNSVLTHLENVEKFETPERLFVDLIRIYGEKEMIREAIDLFLRIPKFRCVPTVCSLNSLLSILCRSDECIQIVPWILIKCQGLNVRIDESSFSILINALSRIGRVDYAVKLLNYISDDGFNPDGKVYSTILSSLCKQKGARNSEALGFFEEMKKVGFCPSRADFSNVIKFLGKQGKGMDALDILSEMKMEGIKPDIACYTMVLYGLVEEQDFARAEELFDEVILFGLIPNIYTYNVYINGLCKQNKVEVGYKMISGMEQLGCKADSTTYNTILGSFCKLDELNRAREIWREMKLKGMSNMGSYRIMMDAFVTRHKIVEACNLLEEMLSKGFHPASSTIDAMISVLCQGDCVFEALHLLEEVFDYAVVPGDSTWKALLIGIKLDPSCINTTLTNLVNA
ncbi:hypothetical protein Ancab_031482 [Ancistrocladus abbreviatus]